MAESYKKAIKLEGDDLMSRWQLADEVRNKFTPIVKEFINKVESEEFPEDILQLTDTELNPYALWKLLEELGYEEVNTDRNGWQMDFWITFKKEGFKTLTIEGTGITFEFKLYVRD